MTEFQQSELLIERGNSMTPIIVDWELHYHGEDGSDSTFLEARPHEDRHFCAMYELLEQRIKDGYATPAEKDAMAAFQIDAELAFDEQSEDLVQQASQAFAEKQYELKHSTV